MFTVSSTNCRLFSVGIVMIEELVIYFFCLFNSCGPFLLMVTRQIRSQHAEGVFGKHSASPAHGKGESSHQILVTFHNKGASWSVPSAAYTTRITIIRER